MEIPRPDNQWFGNNKYSMDSKSSHCNLCDISLAALHGDIDSVNKIIELGIDLSTDNECNTALFDAIESNRFDIALILMENGASPLDLAKTNRHEKYSGIYRGQ